MTWSARVSAALAIVVLCWAACDGSTATTGAAGGRGAAGGSGPCDVCHLPSTCQTDQDCCGGLCEVGTCFVTFPEGYCCSDGDCGPVATCVGHQCMGPGSGGTGGAPTGCTSDADCAAGETCDTTTGECVVGSGGAGGMSGTGGA